MTDIGILNARYAAAASVRMEFLWRLAAFFEIKAMETRR